jgi:hypothetical protein
MCQLWAPTSFRVTYDTSNMDGIDWVIKDPKTGSISMYITFEDTKFTLNR